MVRRRAAAGSVLDQDAGQLLSRQVREVVREDRSDDPALRGISGPLPEAGMERTAR